MKVHIIFMDASAEKTYEDIDNVYTKGDMLVLRQGDWLYKYPLCHIFQVSQKHGLHHGSKAMMDKLRAEKYSDKEIKNPYVLCPGCHISSRMYDWNKNTKEYFEDNGPFFPMHPEDFAENGNYVGGDPSQSYMFKCPHCGRTYAEALLFVNESKEEKLPEPKPEEEKE